METLQSIMTSPVVRFLVMTLLHSLWQGAIIAGLLWLLLRWIKGKPSTRYVLSLVGLVVLIVAQFATYSVLEQRSDHTDFDSLTTAMPAGQESESSSIESRAATVSGQAEGRSKPLAAKDKSLAEALQWEQALFLLWCAGAVLMSLRMVVWLGGVQYLRRRCTVGGASALRQQVETLKGLLRIGRPVLIGFSTRVAVPCTVGFLRPMIVLPLELAQLGAEDIESILLHELAHIKRLDWLVNIMQMALESLLFFNPALWWISRQIRIEREAACDQYVVTRTQKPIHYAQLLLQFAKTDHESRRAVAFASGSDGSLTERVSRLIVPGYKAAVHPGIVPVLLTLAALLFCGVGAYKTTSATVRYFGKHMTPQQRAETVTALKEDYHNEGQTPKLPKDQWIHVRGRIVTVDGKPLPMRTGTYHGRTYTSVDAHLNVRTSNAIGSHQINDDGTFDLTITQTRFSIGVTCNGYAATHIEMECEPGESVDDLVIELEKGYTAYIVCVDPKGQPIPGAHIIGGYPLPPNYGSYTHCIDLTSDANGVVTFDNASEAVMNLTCQASGFVKTKKDKLQLSQGQRFTWVLSPAPTTNVHITDARTGDGIEGVQVYVNGPQFNYSFDPDQKGETVTDASGRAVLDSLAPNESYVVLVRPEGMQRQYFKIQAGQDIEAALEPVQPIRGRIFGDMSKLPIDQDGLAVTVTNTYWVRSDSQNTSSDRLHVPVTVVDPCQVTFEVDEYYGQKVTLSVEPDLVSTDLDIEAGDHLHEVSMHLFPEQTAEDIRMVRFNFTGPDVDAIPPGTTFKVTYREEGKKYGQAHDVEIMDGKAKLAMPMTNSISWEPAVGTPIFFKTGHQNLDEDRDYTIDVTCMPAGSIYGKIDVPKDYQYQYTYIRLEFKNRDRMFEQTGFLPNSGLNMTTAPQTKFMFSPLPLDGEYIVIATCKNMMFASDTVHLTAQKPFCEMKLAWPEKTVTLRGHIVDPNGNPVSNVTYNLSAQGAGHGHGFGKLKTDENGSFDCGQVNADPAITHRLNVDPELWPPYQYPMPTTGKPVVIALKPGVLFTGILKDHNGNLRPNAEFNVQPVQRTSEEGSYINKTIKTDENGRFQAILGDVEYKYYARRRIPRADGRESWSMNPVEFHPRQDNGITIVMDPR